MGVYGGEARLCSSHTRCADRVKEGLPVIYIYWHARLSPLNHIHSILSDWQKSNLQTEIRPFLLLLFFTDRYCS